MDLATLNSLQDFLAQSIPSVKSLGYRLTLVTPEKVEASAPLIENSNHMGTAFGGSLYSVLVLTCYSWLYSNLQSDLPGCHIVIQTGKIDYQKPVGETLHAMCNKPEGVVYEKFLMTLKKKGRGRLKLEATVGDGAATLHGTFVVFAQQ